MSKKGFPTARLFILALITVVSVAAQSAPMHPLVIYGDDNRLEVYEEPDLDRRELADSVAVLLSATSLEADLGIPGLNNILGKSYGVENRLCSTERFFEQSAPGYCSGFLVAENIVATAGHCVTNPDFCEDVRFAFGFMLTSEQDNPRAIPDENIYGCKRVLYDEMTSLGSDFALIELDRPVLNRKPLPIAKSVPLVGEEVFVIGHPVGLPTKISAGASVRRNTTEFFVANLDTFGGNSGSAVFNEQNEVAGILVRGENDFVRRGNCAISYRCPNDLCRGEDVSNADLVAKKLDEILNPAPAQNSEPQVPELRPVPEEWLN
ncbi:MAG: serine protease [Bdellovibrionales bacterium]|jgi:S1-C subfamily serine protease|nr:serine protease [Bdellovibrionales bacterium]